MTKLTEKNVIEETEFFSKTLNELCKEEKKENKKYHNLMKNNYYLRIQGITEDNVKKQLIRKKARFYIITKSCFLSCSVRIK